MLPYQRFPLTLPKSNSNKKLLSPNYHSILSHYIHRSNIKYNMNSNNTNCNSHRYLFPKLFSTSIETTHNHNNKPKITKDSHYEKTKTPFTNTNANHDSIHHHRGNTNTNSNLLKKNNAVKLIFEKCLEYINQDNQIIQNLSNEDFYDNKSKVIKGLISSPRINKYNIYKQLNNDTVSLLRDERKWKPLSKKIETAMNIASKYTINFALNNRKSLKKQFKDLDTYGGYLFLNEPNILDKNIYGNKVKALRQKKNKTQQSHISLTDFITNSTRQKDLLMKRLESNNQKNMKIRIKEQEGEGRYYKVSGYFSYGNSFKKIKKKNAKSCTNKSQ